MFITHWEYAAVACAICLVFYKFVEFRGATKEWGTGMHAFQLSTAQRALIKVDDAELDDPKIFRPQLLLLFHLKKGDSETEARGKRLLHLASQLKAGQGLCVLVAFLCGNPLDKDDRQRADEIRKRLKFDMKEAKLRGFAKTVVHGRSQVTFKLKK
ncbi:unnamed protein product [Gongylonema pulchrum]|uniref:40S ribosomal protein S24 n=1 Tax=Gongylonema pulchrum TaxID=637853 RepID=A0A183DG49_9BILA|nr:unnamed protein product [Gongylonema pulchrum]